jgi:hypothetical protein
MSDQTKEPMSDNLTWVQIELDRGDKVYGKLDPRNLDDAYTRVDQPIDGDWRVMLYSAAGVNCIKILNAEETQQARDQVAKDQQKAEKEDAWKSEGDPHTRKTFGLATKPA